MAVLDETYNTAMSDIGDMQKDANAKINNLMRQGKTAFFGSVMEGFGNAALSYFLGGGSGLMSKAGSAISSSKAGTAVQNWYNSARGWTKGGFSQLPTSNGLPSGNTTKIA